MISDEMLSQAAEELANAINESLPSPQECYHLFSSRFEKNMKRLIYRAEHPTQFRILRSVACILLVILLGFSSVLVISAEAREAVFGWIRQQYQSFYEYFFDGHQKNEATPKYYPGWMPDGYEFEATLEIDGGEIYLFTNAEGAIAQFSYATTATNSGLFIESVDYEYQQVLIHGVTGDLYVAPNDYTRSELIWRDSTGNTLFSISAIAEIEDLVKIAEHVVKK